jgi:2-oxoglutarate ferredoxin oxidoreductase subunit gamma
MLVCPVPLRRDLPPRRRGASAMQREALLSGLGGQGVQLCAKALALAATVEGRQALLSSHYGGEMRGGQTEASVVVADRDLRSVPIIPEAWSAVLMHGRYWPGVAERLRPGGVVVANASVVDVNELDPSPHEGFNCFTVPAGTLAEEIGAPMSAGFVLLGAYAAITGLVGSDALVDAMRQLVPPYRAQHVQANEAALRAGAEAGTPQAAPAWIDPVAGEGQTVAAGSARGARP